MTEKKGNNGVRREKDREKQACFPCFVSFIFLSVLSFGTLSLSHLAY